MSDFLFVEVVLNLFLMECFWCGVDMFDIGN